MEGYNLRFWSDYYEVLKQNSFTGARVDGKLRRIHFYERGYTGNPFAMQRQEDHFHMSVVTFQTETQEQELFGPIVGRKAIIKLVLSETFTLNDILTKGERDFWVTIDESDNEGFTFDRNLFTGWLSTFDVKEPFEQAPYLVEVSASCGIGSLKNVPYSNYPDKKIRRGIGITQDALLHCLAHLGYDMPIYTSLRIAEEFNLLPPDKKVPAPPFSPLPYATHDEQLFQGKSCYEVLKIILESMGARICQQEGAFRIIRWIEYSHPHTATPIGSNPEFVRWRDNGSLISGTPPVGTWEKTEQVSRTVDRDGDGIPLKGGQLFYEPIYHKAEVIVDYGAFRNELPNGDFGDLSGNLPTGFQKSNQLPARRIGTGTVEDPFALQIDGAAYYRDNTGLDGYYVLFPPVEVPSRNGSTSEDDLWTLSLTYINRNTRGLKLMIVAQSKKRNYYLQQDGTWKSNVKGHEFYWGHDNYYQDSKNVMKAKPTKGVAVDIEMPAVPTKDPYTLQILAYRGRALDGQVETPQPQIELQNVKLSRRDTSKVELKGERYIATMQTQDPVRSAPETTLLLADQLNVRSEYIELNTNTPGGEVKHTFYRYRTGGMRRIDTVQPTQKWQAFYMLTQPQPLAKILAFDRLGLLGAVRRGFEGDLFCMEPIRPLDVLVFPEILGSFNQPLRMVILSHEIGDHSQICRVRAIEVPAAIGGIIQVSGYWETTDGVLIPMDDSEPEVPGAGPKIGKLSGLQNAALNQILAQRAATSGLSVLDLTPSDGQGHQLLRPGSPEALFLKVTDKGVQKFIAPATKLVNSFGLKIR